MARRGRPPVWLVLAGAAFLAVIVAGALWASSWHADTSLADAAGPPRRALVVLYANETTRHAVSKPHYRSVLRVLESAKGDLAKELHADLIADAREFPSAIARNYEALVAHARRGAFDLALFSNDLARSRTYVLFRSEQMREETMQLPSIEVSDHPFVATAPLSDPEMMRAALRDLIGRYPALPLDVVLLTFSHGALGMALMPRVNIDLRAASEVEIRRNLERSEQISTAPGWAALRGTTNPAFWTVLREVGAAHPNVRFPLVVRGSCQSTLASLEEFFAIPPIVGLVGHTGVRSPSIKSVRLESILADLRSPFSLTALARGAREAGFSVDGQWSLALWLVPVALWQIPFAVYCIPVALWLTLVGWLHKRNRATGRQVHAVKDA